MFTHVVFFKVSCLFDRGDQSGCSLIEGGRYIENKEHAASCPSFRPRISTSKESDILDEQRATKAACYGISTNKELLNQQNGYQYLLYILSEGCLPKTSYKIAATGVGQVRQTVTANCIQCEGTL